jgi:hypothetical protein
VSVIDPFDVLREHLRAQDVPDPLTTVDALVEDILSGAIPAPDLRRRSRRARRALGFGLGAVVLAGGSLAAATLLRQEEVTSPHVGATCRAAASRTANMYTVGVTDDPVGACRALWESGVMNQVRDNAMDVPVPASEISVPELVSCISEVGAIEVFPVRPGETCDVLDLAPLGTVDLVGNPLVLLQERISTEINMTCIATEDAPPIISQMLRDLDLGGWTIVIGSHRPEAPCSIVGLAPEERRIYVVHSPLPPPSTVMDTLP